MYLDLAKLLASRDSGGELQYTLPPPTEPLRSDVQQDGPATVRVGWQKQRGGLSLFVHMEGNFLAQCARCLKQYNLRSVTSREFYIDDSLQDPEQLLPIEGTRLIIEDLARDEFDTGLPMVLLCEESCPGLCPTCGKPKDQCGCETHDTQMEPKV